MSAPISTDLDAVTGSSPCRAWSLHAAELALLTSRDLEVLPDTPSTRSQVLHDPVWPLRPGVHVSAGSLRTMADRAVAIGCALGADLRASHVIAGESAIWVYAGGRPPREIALLSLARPVSLAGVRMRQAPLTVEDVDVVGGCPVVVAERAALDVLRFRPDDEDAEAHAEVTALLDAGLTTATEIRSRLHALGRTPHVRRAARRWADVLDGLRSPQPAGRDAAAAASTRCPSAVTR